MPHREDQAEERAIALLNEFIQLAEERRDCLPGTAVGLVKRARVVMKKRRHRPSQYHRKMPAEYEDVY